MGFLNGLVAPIAFVVSLFNSDIRVYAFPNAGLWYDFGFLLGLVAWGGGGAAAAGGNADDEHSDEVYQLRRKVRRLRRRLRGGS